MQTAATSKRRIWPVLLFALPALAVLLALGTWQVQRLAWKEGLLATIDQRINAEPVPLADLLAELETGAIAPADIEYRPVTVIGTFDHTQERFFFATHKGISGYFIYTPMRVSEPQGKVLFVNRGFVPFDFTDPASRPQSQPSGTVTLDGLARQRLDDKPGMLVPDNDPAKNIYYWKDLDAMAAASGISGDDVLPMFVDAGLPEKDYPLGEWPVPGQTIINLPNSHLQYAVTWYGLALVLVVVTGIFIRRRMAA